MYKRLRFPAIVSLSLVVIMGMTSCSNSEEQTSSTDENEIVAMDSTAKVIDEKTSSLESQTKQVEESLESLDNEFENTK